MVSMPLSCSVEIWGTGTTGTLFVVRGIRHGKCLSGSGNGKGVAVPFATLDLCVDRGNGTVPCRWVVSPPARSILPRHSA
jgi:hypothetical protein